LLVSSVRSPDQALPQRGEIVAGKYRIESEIGAGGMGVVLGAQDTSLGRAVAIKFLSPSKSRRDGAVQRFLREARAAASIESEHVVRVFEVGTLPSGSPFIVMEHLRGADLSQVLAARGGLPIDEAVDYLLQACEALGEAHGRGIVHRDLKPHNLFVATRPDGSPCVKVLDFGISKAIEEGAPNLTSTDQVMGTPLYMSPEQVRSLKNVDHRSDIWALGSILFELLTASPIYEAPSASALCAMIAMDPPARLRDKRPAAPPELEAIILRCLHKDPAGRFQDVGALAAALAPFASERGRQSALRISRVVRSGGVAGTGPGPGSPMVAHAGSGPFGPGAPASPYGTTADGSGQQRPSQLPVGPSGYPPPTVTSGPPPGVTATSHHPPPHHHVTTQQTWQQTTGTGFGPGPLATATGEQKRGTSSVVVALLGVLTGVVVLALLSVGAWFVYSHKMAEEASAAKPDASVAAAARAPAPAPTPSAAPSASASAAPTQAPTATAKKPQPAAPAAAKDAGAPAPAAPKAPDPDEELEGQRRLAEQSCAHQRFLLSRNDPANNNQARQVKTMMCLRSMGPQGASCERAVCRSACSMLQDQTCIRQLDAADRNLKPRF